MHTVTSVIDNQRMQKTHLMYTLTYTNLQCTHVCTYPQTNLEVQPGPKKKYKKNQHEFLSLSFSLSPQKTAYTPRWPQSARGNVEVNGGCHYAKFGRLCIHSLQEKGNINIQIGFLLISTTDLSKADQCCNCCKCYAWVKPFGGSISNNPKHIIYIYTNSRRTRLHANISQTGTLGYFSFSALAKGTLCVSSILRCSENQTHSITIRHIV